MCAARVYLPIFVSPLFSGPPRAWPSDQDEVLRRSDALFQPEKGRPEKKKVDLPPSCYMLRVLKFLSQPHAGFQPQWIRGHAGHVARPASSIPILRFGSQFLGPGSPHGAARPRRPGQSSSAEVRPACFGPSTTCIVLETIPVYFLPCSLDLNLPEGCRPPSTSAKGASRAGGRPAKARSSQQATHRGDQAPRRAGRPPFTDPSITRRQGARLRAHSPPPPVPETETALLPTPSNPWCAPGRILSALVTGADSRQLLGQLLGQQGTLALSSRHLDEHTRRARLPGQTRPGQARPSLPVLHPIDRLAQS
jgi:hypothetical protein